MKKTVLLLTSMAAAVLVACMTAVLSAGPGIGQTATVTLVGAGDIAGCSQKRDSSATARLLGNIPGTVFTLGDNAYESGTQAEFDECYEPTWGRFKDITYPAVGTTTKVRRATRTRTVLPTTLLRT